MKMIKYLKCIGFILGLVILLKIMSGPFGRDGGLYVYDAKAVNVKAAELEAEPDNTIDVLFVGDSECYSSFSPLHMWDNYGYTSFVCGTSAQRLCDTYAILQEAFKTQSPKVIVLETNCLYRSIRKDENVDDMALEELTERFDVFAYHSDWKNFVGKCVTNTNHNKRSNTKGFLVRNSINPYTGGDYMIKTDDVRNMEADVCKYLDDIDTICRENGASLVLVSTPSPKNWNYEKHNGVMQWAEENSVSYIDLNLIAEIGIDWATDTKDGGDHLNLEGAKKVTYYLGGILGELCELQDTRNNPDYEDWVDYCTDLD